MEEQTIKLNLNIKNMKTKSLILTFLILLLSCDIFAQKDHIDKTNQFNEKGQKEGYWTEDRGFDKVELYYHNGKKSGLFKSYSKKGTLDAFGEFKDDEISGTWYYFGDKGHLISIRKDFAKNTKPVLLDIGQSFVYPHKCYYISFYPNGKIEEEGVLLWDEDPELDTVHEYGEWKYYDESGKLTRTKIFK